MSMYGSLKTEHAGHKGSTRKSGYWGKRLDAKKRSNKKRRTESKRAALAGGVQS